MSRPKSFSESAVVDGRQTVTLPSWRYFADYINKQLLDYSTYIFRGHASGEWKLSPTIDRLLKGTSILQSFGKRRQQLENFKISVRGRRGPTPTPLTQDNEWWSLGQHFGLATPLLDWTESPFVALFFAVADGDSDASDQRAVFAVSRSALKKKNAELSEAAKKAPTKTIRLGSGRTISLKNAARIVDIVHPLTDDNARLVSQRGLFTRAPDGMSIEDWTTLHFKGSTERILIKIQFPNKDRERCLRFLNRANINHLSLFPDLYGASKYTNFSLEIDSY